MLFLILGLTLLLPLQSAADGAPSLTRYPVDRVVESSGVATFFCAAEGVPAPTLEWRKNGKRLPSTRWYRVVEASDGTKVLRIEHVRQGRDDATYECVAENGRGDPVVAKAQLKIIDNPSLIDGFPNFSVQPQVNSMEKGHPALLTCKALGDPVPKVMWLKDGIPVDMEDPRFSLTQGTSLQISDAQEEDTGSYECLAENSVGTAVSSPANLYVKARRVPPYFTIQPVPMHEVTPGSSLNVTCVAAGSPLPFIKWRKGSLDLTPENELPIGKNVLQLEDIRESANYTCIASSNLGNIEVHTQVLVQALPRPPSEVQISDITSSSVRLTWSYLVPLEDVNYYVVQYKAKHGSQDYSEISGVTSLFYIIQGLSPYTEYEFYVIAVNAIGRGAPSNPAVVTTGETEPGSAPRNVVARPLGFNAVVVQWDPPKEPNGQVTGYKLFYTSQPSLPPQAWNVIQLDNGKLTTISGLTTHTIYTIRVQAFTSRGQGPLSAPVQVKTQQGVPSQPAGIRAVSTSSSSIKISWSKPLHRNENVMGYEIYWNDTFADQSYQRAIPDVQSYVLGELYPDTTYYIWVAAKSRQGEGAATAPLVVRTEQYVPGAPPQSVGGQSLDSRSLRINWKPPPRDKQNGIITYYKIKYLKADQGQDPGPAQELEVGSDERSQVIAGLEKWTEYRIWVLAGTRVGDGPLSAPLLLRTDEDVPGEPRHVKVMALNSTTINVRWKAPGNRERNGLIRGYQIHVHETIKNGDLVNEPMRFDVADENADEFNVTGLQPDTEYVVQVAAVTRKGDGSRSHAKPIKTMGGVPTRPDMSVHIVDEEPHLKVQVQWKAPTHRYGILENYRLKYRRIDLTQSKEMEIAPTEDHIMLDNLDRGARYEFLLAGKNGIGWGQEALEYLDTPEGIPSSAPLNVTYRLQSPTTLVLSWVPPPAQDTNGHVILYGYYFHRSSEAFPTDKNTTSTRIVLSSLDENTEFAFRVCAYTSMGGGPFSPKLLIQTPGDVPPAPSSVQAMATSERSVEVWWDEVPYFKDILGYQVLYVQTPVEDLDKWNSKNVPLTWSAEINGLDSNTMYAIRVAAFTKQGLGRLSELITIAVTPIDVPIQLSAHGVTTHSMDLFWKPPLKLDPIKYKITYGAHKEFYDSRGHLQVLHIKKQVIFINAENTSVTVDQLLPFTSYQVNVTAIPPDEGFRPAAKITVTTTMAAPTPMVKPDFIEVENNQITVILPQASEEYGFISHYYLVVVPEQYAKKEPDTFTIEELKKDSGPYIAAKFARRSLPDRFQLGDNKVYLDFRNKKLDPDVDYQIFVRAVVDTPQKESLYTSSPFSHILSLERRAASPPLIDDRDKGSHPDMAQIESGTSQADMLWIIGPVVIILVMMICLITLMILRRRHHAYKSPGSAGETTMKLLPGSGGLAGLVGERELTAHPTDPVEQRRLNYQTPAMMSHPPIPLTELTNHIERLKANDNLLFSQEYESIEPGQQFTWENSNLDANKPKNRYANVIAYDHSRVVLQTLEGIPGSDYINANYCDGYRRQNAYIATQGPLQETFGDFWRMVWEQHSATILMMTKLEERTRVKCDQYWPNRGTESFGGIQVTFQDMQELATYCIRSFLIQKSGSSEKREVKQLQFTAWPDHGVPDHPTPFLVFLRRVRHLNPPDAGPMIVHCSAGVGRTGCFIVIDSMLERMKQESSLDIYGHVTCLRAQRNYMVQTEDQYIFIHDAVLEAVLAGHTEVMACNLYAHIQSLLQPQDDNVTGMEMEFKRLSSMKSQPSKFLSANLPVNKFKNRLMNILPYESSRVCLQPIRNIEGSDYINASYVDGYRYRSAYIATQGPLAETNEDFWRMLWEHNCNIIVMLTNLTEMGREKCFQYWPSERSQRYLYFVVDPITEYNMPQYILREFKVTDGRDGQSRTIRQFHFVDWPEQGVPKSGDGFIEFIGQVHKTKEQFGQEGPITVHCSAGVGRTGVFITLSIVLGRMQYESIVDMFQTVRTLRTQRPGMVQTEDQYRFCYNAALEYLGSFDHYAH